MRSNLIRALSTLATVLIVGLWAVTFRPQALGGPALYVIVRGDSMLPTYANGDLLLVEAANDYRTGDPVAYRVPAGELGAGHLVIHRIIGGDGSKGYLVQGDNNPAPDPWTPEADDMAGRVAIAVPWIGQLIASVVRPIVAASLVSAIVVAWLLFPRPANRKASAGC